MVFAPRFDLVPEMLAPAAPPALPPAPGFTSDAILGALGGLEGLTNPVAPLIPPRIDAPAPIGVGPRLGSALGVFLASLGGGAQAGAAAGAPLLQAVEHQRRAAQRAAEFNAQAEFSAQAEARRIEVARKAALLRMLPDLMRAEDEEALRLLTTARLTAADVAGSPTLVKRIGDAFGIDNPQENMDAVLEVAAGLQAQWEAKDEELRIKRSNAAANTMSAQASMLNALANRERAETARIKAGQTDPMTVEQLRLLENDLPRLVQEAAVMDGILAKYQGEPNSKRVDAKDLALLDLPDNSPLGEVRRVRQLNDELFRAKAERIEAATGRRVSRALTDQPAAGREMTLEDAIQASLSGLGAGAGLGVAGTAPAPTAAALGGSLGPALGPAPGPLPSFIPATSAEIGADSLLPAAPPPPSRAVAPAPNLPKRLPSGLPGGQRAARWRPIVQAAAHRAGVDPALAMAVVVQESAGDPRAVSHAGAQGLMQLMPGTAREVGVQNSFDPVDNVLGGTEYLARMLRMFGNEREALAAYNWGPGNVQRGGRWPAETQNYVRKVLVTRNKLSQR